jgi:hypothetical protein
MAVFEGAPDEKADGDACCEEGDEGDDGFV